MPSPKHPWDEFEATDLFNELIRGSVRQAFWQMMSDEVEALCGPRYRPDSESDYRRAGSEQGRVYLDGEKEDIVRPRVRHEENGEVTLERGCVGASALPKTIV